MVYNRHMTNHPFCLSRATPFSAGDELPTQVRVLLWGDNPNSNGETVVVGQELVMALADPLYAYSRIPIDFEHNTVPGTVAYAETCEPRAIAGYGHIEVSEEQGVVLIVDEWTALGQERARDFADVSAAALLDANGHVTAIVSVALTRTGAVPGMTFTQAVLAALPHNQIKTNEMKLLQKIADLLGLGEDVDEDVIIDAVTKLSSAGGDDATAEQPVEPAETTAPGENVDARITAIEKRLAQLLEIVEGDRKRELVLSAQAEGKQIRLSDSAIATLSVDDLRQLLDSIPATVPLSAQTRQPVDSRRHTISAEERAVASAFGLSAEAIWKE